MHNTTNEVTNIAKNYKYTLWFHWQNLTKAEQRIALIRICDSLGISLRTFQSWMYYNRHDNIHYIPAEHLYRLATFFGVRLEEMWTEKPQSLHLLRTQISNELKQTV